MLLHTTHNQVEIYVKPGSKSAWDFVVTHKELGKRQRTPKHIHLIVDLFAKRVGNPQLCHDFVSHTVFSGILGYGRLLHTPMGGTQIVPCNQQKDCIINNIIQKVTPVSQFPPVLQVFTLSHSQAFNGLDQYGDYSTEFFLVIVELIMIQDRTNYPSGTMTLRLFQQFQNNADIFTMISMATFRKNP